MLQLAGFQGPVSGPLDVVPYKVKKKVMALITLSCSKNAGSVGWQL